MTIRSLILTLLFAATPLCADSPDTERDRAELERLLREFMAGASVNDAAVHDRFWSEELVYTSSSGTRFGKQEIMEGLSGSDAGDAPAVVYRAEDVDTRVYGDFAVIAFRLVGKGAESESGYFNTGTFVKSEGRWQAVAWQATKIPAEPNTDP